MTDLDPQPNSEDYVPEREPVEPAYEGPTTFSSKPVIETPSQNNNKRIIWIVVAVVALLLCCCCIALVLAYNWVGSNPDIQDIFNDMTRLPTLYFSAL